MATKKVGDGKVPGQSLGKAAVSGFGILRGG
jgi:hypothetical protein